VPRQVYVASSAGRLERQDLFGGTPPRRVQPTMVAVTLGLLKVTVGPLKIGWFGPPTAHDASTTSPGWALGMVAVQVRVVKGVGGTSASEPRRKLSRKSELPPCDGR
jgi:hypothetical protein